MLLSVARGKVSEGIDFDQWVPNRYCADRSATMVELSSCLGKWPSLLLPQR